MLIWVSVNGFGRNGPRSQYRSCDLIASAYGGQMYVTGSPSTPPLKPFGEQSYYSASLFAAVGILLALRKRAQSGKGEHLDLSLQESVVSTLDHVMVRYFYEQTVPKRQGNVYWNHSFSILPCRDGHILITPFQQWETLVEWMESEGMAEDLGDENYRQAEYRLAHVDHILRVLEQWTRTHTAKELFESAQLMRFPWAPVSPPNEVLRNPQLEAREFFVDVEHPEREASISYPGSPYQFSRFSPSRWKRAPLIGEDNVQIYQKELGLSDEEYRRLSSLGVI
jgi:benzylsuccinate CoA-transferase BbsE subunit